MPKYVAIDVGVSKVRYLLAEVVHKKIQVLGYGSLHEQDAEGSSSADESSTSGSGLNTTGRLKPGDHETILGKRLAAELAKSGGSGAQAIVAMRRADVDIRRFTLPPATDDELAELVAVQVLSDGGGNGEGGVIDYVSQPSTPDGGRSVEAVVATNKIVEAYQAIGNSAGVKLRRLVLRPYASASLLRYFQDQRKSEAQASETTLLVNRIGAEVDLIATWENQVLLWRTVQLDEEPDDSSATDGLTAEIVRTVAIAPAHLPAGRAIEWIQLLGSDGEHTRLAAKLVEQTNLRVEILDPTSLAEVSGGESLGPVGSNLGDGDLDGSNLDGSNLDGGAAPLLAMILGEVTTTLPAIDLLNPRKPPQPRNHKRVALLAALAGLVLLYVGGTWLQGMHAELDQANAGLTSKLLELRKQGKKLVPQVALARSIAGWESTGIVWLDELRDLTRKFPSAEDVTVRGMTISSLRGGGAMIRVTGQVRDPAVIVRMDHDLRDQFRNATSKNFREQSNKGEPSWRFETDITTRRRPAEDYLAMNSLRGLATGKKTELNTAAISKASQGGKTAPSGLPDRSSQSPMAAKGVRP